MNKILTGLAKMAVENYIKEEKIIDIPENLPEKIKKERAGVFVTIEKNGDLRGCVGTPIPTKKNIVEEIISNSISAATKDFRFGKIKEEELPKLSYTVYILEKLIKIVSTSELNPKEYGIIVKSLENPLKSGLLLPDLEEIKTKEEQVFFACHKAGINIKKEPIEIYKFKAKKYK